jgi:hypothetical protein
MKDCSQSVEKQFPHLVAYSDVRDVGKPRRIGRSSTCIIYHSAYRWAAAASPKTLGSVSRKRGVSSGFPTSPRYPQNTA